MQNYNNRGNAFIYKQNLFLEGGKNAKRKKERLNRGYRGYRDYRDCNRTIFLD